MHLDMTPFFESLFFGLKIIAPFLIIGYVLNNGLPKLIRLLADIFVGLRVERAQIQETNHMTGREFEV